MAQVVLERSAVQQPVEGKRKFSDRIFGTLCLVSIILAIAALALLLVTIFRDGASRIRPDFFQNFTSRNPAIAGIKAPLLGTLWVVGLTALISVPIGIAAAVYLEEYSLRKNRVTTFIQLNIANLAGVPSIVYGLLGLAIFVRWMSLDRSIIAGALTMSLLILPTVIIVSQEALRAVPYSYREGAYALGATQWQTIRTQVLRNALPGILTGVILSISRAIGETAPLITIGALTYTAAAPDGLRDKFTVLPIQIYDWSSRPQAGFHENAAAAILVLLGVLLLLNSIAIYLRNRYGTRS
jgi:phosphate transport system permease protein